MRIGKAPPGTLGWSPSHPCAGGCPPDPEAATSLRLSIELVYDPGCPNVDRARALLTRALHEAGLPAVWTEWSTGDERCPATHRSYGSPTILVNGRDVAPGPHPWAEQEEHDGPRCRVYRTDRGPVSGVPPMERVRAAIDDAMGPHAG